MIPAAHNRVLVVDDEPDMLELIADVLRRDGLNVDAASTGAEARQLAERSRPDLVVADLHLPDGNGLDVVDDLRDSVGRVPTVVITGLGDTDAAAEACRRGCIDFITKPLDVDRLREAVRRELDRRVARTQARQRTKRYRRIAREMNRRRRHAEDRLNNTCSALTTAYQTLNRQFMRQESLLRFHRNLLTCQCDDDVFRNLFGYFCEDHRTLFGVAMVCDENAELQIVGRFGTPTPDSVSISQSIAYSLLDIVLDGPSVMTLDFAQHHMLFPAWVHEHLEGVQFMLMPLLPSEGQLIGLVIFYRKNGEAFSADEVAMAEMLGPSIALCMQGAEPHAESGAAE